MTWRVGKNVPINVYGEDDRPIAQCHTAIDAKLIVDAVNDREADSRDWQQIALAIGFRSDATREQIVDQCRALTRAASRGENEKEKNGNAH
jgi:hypothetical protein